MHFAKETFYIVFKDFVNKDLVFLAGKIEIAGTGEIKGFCFQDDSLMNEQLLDTARIKMAVRALYHRFLTIDTNDPVAI